MRDEKSAIGIAGNIGDPTVDELPKKPALDVASFVAKFVPGAASVTAEQYQDRLEVCASCIYRVTGPAGHRCRACGCFVAIKAKLRGFHCPQGKWEGDATSLASSP